MEYVVVGVLALAVAGAFVAYLIATTVRKARAADTAPPGIGRDPTPFGDTAEHAGEQDESGLTRTPADAETAGGTGRSVSGERSIPPAGGEERRAPGHRFQRDPVGGEAEARPYSDPRVGERRRH